MSIPIFSFKNKEESGLIRTSESITCGITNIPLTKPARVWFIIDKNDKQKKEKINHIHAIGNSINYDFGMTELNSGNIRLITKHEIPSMFIKMIWNNFRSLRPKFQTNWRYFLWEIDDMDNYDIVHDLYLKLNLPVYIHRSMRGWHFLSVKPIDFRLWKSLCEQIQHTNPSFPRITLRIKPNKYLNEDKVFHEGFIRGVHHSDTIELANLIQKANYDKIGTKYQLVYYDFEGKEHDRFE